MEKRDNSMIISKNLILNEFNFLEREYYFTPHCRDIQDATFIEKTQLEYINEVRRRNVRVSCVKGKVINDVIYTFTASITRIPYVGNEDYFSLNNYLESIGKDFDTSLTNEFNEKVAEEILKKIAAALKEHALKIIEGSVWLETYYPRRD